MALSKEDITTWFKELQDSICKELEITDGKGMFTEDLWEREGGGGGRSRILQNGNIIEKGGVGFSAVHGVLADPVKQLLKVNKTNFYATGVSIVIHPHSPMVPIIHMNVRYFEIDNETKWFGGGIDLTPHYVVKEDAAFFHKKLQQVCDAFSPEYYKEFKKWADDYFFIKHRNETRGIGGIFFDRLSADETHTIEGRFNFVKSVGNSFAPIYTHFMNKNNLLPYGEEHKNWQLIRRGRYAEFNLVYDQGTKFGLDTNGRTESILMSLPPLASWLYNHIPAKGSAEEKTLALLKKDIDWVNL